MTRPMPRSRLWTSWPGVASIAMRNRIAHGYDTVDDGIVHETVSTRFAPLLEALQRELRALGRP